MAKIKGSTPQQVIPGNFKSLRGSYLVGNRDGINPTTDFSMPAESAALYGAEGAALLLLRLPKPHIPRQNQFQRLESPKGYQPDSPDGHSKLGTPTYGTITLGDPDKDVNEYTDAQGNKGQYRTVILDCAVVDDIDFNNKVVKTDIQGLPYSITEFISSGDNDVTITGIFNSTPGVAPMDFIINLNNVFSAPVSIPVQNYYLNANNIYYIKIMPGTKMGQVKGEYATQRFTIVALSDVPMSTMLP